MRPLYIFDLDGTLANCAHRLCYINGETKNWRAFFEACADDRPIHSTIATLKALRRSGAEIRIWTGRSDEVRVLTLEWLHRHGCMRSLWNPLRRASELRMRKAGDHRPDHELKLEWLNAEIDWWGGEYITAVFEDRARVVQMWREAGVPCYQVAPGDF